MKLILCVFIAIAMAGRFAAPALGEEVPQTAWRSPANGGINALYCYLRANGIKCDYPNLVKGQREEMATGTNSAMTLVRLSARNNLPLQTVSLTMAELDACPLPVIVHMDSESPEVGSFILLLGITDQAVSFVNGPSASIQSMSREDFRRVWSGIALLPAADRKKDVALCLAGLGAGLLLPLAIRYARRKSIIRKELL